MIIILINNRRFIVSAIRDLGRRMLSVCADDSPGNAGGGFRVGAENDTAIIEGCNEHYRCSLVVNHVVVNAIDNDCARLLGDN